MNLNLIYRLTTGRALKKEEHDHNLAELSKYLNADKITINGQIFSFRSSTGNSTTDSPVVNDIAFDGFLVDLSGNKTHWGKVLKYVGVPSDVENWEIMDSIRI